MKTKRWVILYYVVGLATLCFGLLKVVDGNAFGAFYFGFASAFCLMRGSWLRWIDWDRTRRLGK